MGGKDHTEEDREENEWEITNKSCECNPVILAELDLLSLFQPLLRYHYYSFSSVLKT